jgi:hypothetical protein
MKNIHVLQTDKIIKNVGDLVKDQYGDTHIFTKNDGKEYGKTTTKLNIYITNSKEIKEGDYCIIVDAESALYGQFEKHKGKHLRNDQWEKIILTTDQELIKDGVQAIPDDFLEWFVNNPSCEEVRIEKWFDKSSDEEYFIPIISKEEPLEEVALFVYPIHLIWDEEERYDCNQELRKTFIDGAKWQQEHKQFFNDDRVKTLEKGLELLIKTQQTMYSEEDLKEAFAMGRLNKNIKDFNQRFKNK